MFSEEKADFHPVAFSAGLPGGIQLSQSPNLRNMQEAVREAMYWEMENLRSHDVYELVLRARGMHAHLEWNRKSSISQSIASLIASRRFRGSGD